MGAGQTHRAWPMFLCATWVVAKLLWANRVYNDCRRHFAPTFAGTAEGRSHQKTTAYEAPGKFDEMNRGARGHAGSWPHLRKPVVMDLNSVGVYF